MSSYGAGSSSGINQFKVVEVASNGTVTDVAGASWSHAANTLFDTHTISGTSLTGLGGKNIYIICTEGVEDASGYTATLIWKRV